MRAEKTMSELTVIRYETSGREVEFPDGEDVNLLRLSIRHDCGLPWNCATGTRRATAAKGC